MKTSTIFFQLTNDFKLIKSLKKRLFILFFLLINWSVYAQTIWTGTVDSNWFNPLNWTIGVPSNGIDAIVLSTPNNPIIGSNSIYGHALINNLTIESGAMVTIAPWGVLGVFGILTNNAGTSGILIESDENGGLPMGSLLYQNDVTTNPVPATVKFYSKSYTDLSDPLNPDYKWQYFGIPFEKYIPGYTLGKYKPYSWDETFTNSTNWKVVENNDTMKLMKGYAITQDNIDYYLLSGNLIDNSFYSTIDTVLSYTTGNGSDFPGNHILSNPHTFSLSILDNIIFENMDASIGFYNTGSLADWSLYSGTSGTNPGQYLNVPQNQAGNNGLPLSIPSMQGFLVNATQPTSKISFTVNGTIFLNWEPMRAKKTTQDKVCTIIDIAGSNYADKVWLFTDASCTKDFDNGWDSRKLMGSDAAPQLFFVENDYKFQVSTVDDINGSFLGFRKGIDNEYTMTFTHNNAELAYPNGIYLMDLVANKTVNVTENGSTYTFTANRSSLAKAAKVPAETEVVRFKIVTSPGMTTDINTIKNEIKVIVSEKSIIFDNQTKKQAQMTLFDVTGKVIMNSAVQAGVSSVNVNVPAGTYIVQVVADRTNIKSSIIIK